MLWHRETHINPQRNRWIIVNPAGIELTTSRLRQLRQLPVVQHVRFTPLQLRKKTQLEWHAALDKWQPVWNAQVSISTPVCANFELRPGAGDIKSTHRLVCWHFAVPPHIGARYFGTFFFPSAKKNDHLNPKYLISKQQNDTSNRRPLLSANVVESGLSYLTIFTWLNINLSKWYYTICVVLPP